MARELLAPIVDQDVLRPGHEVARGGQPGEPAADDAAVDGGANVGGATVGRRAGHAPRRSGAADRRVKDVEDVDVRSGRELGVQDHILEAPIPVVVDLGPQVGEDVGRRVGQAVEDLDEARFLGHEDPPVRRELERDRVIEPLEDGRDLEAWLRRLARRRRDAALLGRLEHLRSDGRWRLGRWPGYGPGRGTDGGHRGERREAGDDHDRDGALPYERHQLLVTHVQERTGLARGRDAVRELATGARWRTAGDGGSCCHAGKGTVKKSEAASGAAAQPLTGRRRGWLTLAERRRPIGRG